jgi:hypothetical protein
MPACAGIHPMGRGRFATNGEELAGFPGNAGVLHRINNKNDSHYFTMGWCFFT